MPQLEQDMVIAQKEAKKAPYTFDCADKLPCVVVKVGSGAGSKTG